MGGKLHQTGILYACEEKYIHGNLCYWHYSIYFLVIILTTGWTDSYVYVQFVYLYCPISLPHACVSQVFFNTCMHVWEGVRSVVFCNLLMIGAFSWRGGLCFGNCRDKGFVLHIPLFLRVLEWWVGGCLYTHAHTHRPLGYLMWAQVWDGHWESPKNSDRLKRIIHVDRECSHCTFVYIYAGLQVLMIWPNCHISLKWSILLQKVEDVMTISKLQSLTSLRLIDCTLRVPNKTSTLFLYEKQ